MIQYTTSILFLKKKSSEFSNKGPKKRRCASTKWEINLPSMEPIDKNSKLASYQCMSHNLQNLQNKNTLAQSCSYFLGNENFKISSKHFMLYTLISVRKVYLNIQSFYLNNKKEMRPQRSLFFLPNSCLILPNSFEDDEFEDGGKEKGKMLWGVLPQKSVNPLFCNCQNSRSPTELLLSYTWGMTKIY